MGTDNSNVRKSSLVATVLFAIAFAVYSFLLISDFENNTTGKNIQKSILAVLFGALTIMNYLKYKRAKV